MRREQADRCLAPAHDVAKTPLADDLRGVAQHDQQEGHQQRDRDQCAEGKTGFDLEGDLARRPRIECQHGHTRVDPPADDQADHPR